MVRTPKPSLNRILNNLNSGLRIAYSPGDGQHRLMRRVGNGYEIVMQSNDPDKVLDRYQEELRKLRP